MRGVSLFYYTSDLCNSSQQTVYKNKLIQQEKAQKLFRTYPFLPVEFDIIYGTYTTLELCKDWDIVKGTKQYMIRQDRTERRYLLSHKIGGITSSYLQCVNGINLFQLDNHSEDSKSGYSRDQYRNRFGKSNKKEEEEDRSSNVTENHAYSILSKCFELLRRIAIDLRLFCAWRLNHPIPVYKCSKCERRLPVSCFRSIQTDSICCIACEDGKPIESDYSECNMYARCVYYNYSKEEVSLIIQCLCYQSVISSFMLENWDSFKEAIASVSYASTQHLIKVDVLYWLHHADKQGKKLQGDKALLLKIREVICDWLDELPPAPESEYKLDTKKRRDLVVKCVNKAVMPSNMQIHVLDCLLSLFADPASTASSVRTYFYGTLLKPKDLGIIHKYQELLQTCVSLFSFQHAIQSITTNPYFTVYELLLETARSWNVPSTLFFPQHCLLLLLEDGLNTTVDSYTAVLKMGLDGYDCCRSVLKKEWLIQEEEEGIGTLLNTLIKKSSDEIYRWCKENACRSILHERGLKENDTGVTSIMCNIKLWDKDVFICGHTINLYHTISKQLLSIMRQDIQLAITRLEQNSISFIIEFNTLLTILEATYRNLSTIIDLPPFSELVHPINSSTQTIIGMNRYNQWIIREIANLITNAVYSKDTNVFILDMAQKPSSIKTASYYLYGKREYRMLFENKEMQLLFGRDHIRALFEVGERLEVSWLSTTVKELEKQLGLIIDIIDETICNCNTHPAKWDESQDVAHVFAALESNYNPPGDDTVMIDEWNIFMMQCCIVYHVFILLNMLEDERNRSDSKDLLLNLIKEKSDDGNIDFIEVIGNMRRKDTLYCSTLQENQKYLRSRLTKMSHVYNASVPLFAKKAQSLVSNTVLISHMVQFMDTFVISSFPRVKEEGPILLEGSCFTLGFLLLVTNTYNLFVEDSQSMQFFTLCQERNADNDKCVNDHVKKFLVYSVKVNDMIKSFIDVSLVKEVVDNRYTTYHLDKGGDIIMDSRVDDFMSIRGVETGFKEREKAVAKVVYQKEANQPSDGIIISEKEKAEGWVEMVVSMTCTASHEGDLSLTKNEHIAVQKMDNRRGKGRNGRGDIGFVPMVYLKSAFGV